jgi:long-chain acyl-CoA synthetase
MNDTINTIALNTCRDTGHFIHFQCGKEVHSYSLAELDRRAAVLAACLLERGVRVGDRVGILGQNRVEWVILELAILKLGAVTAGFEPGRFAPQELVQTYGLKLLFGEGLTTGGPVLDIELARKWSERPDVQPARVPLHRGYDPADIFAIRFTSGSTGKPKGLEVTVGSVDSSLAAVTQMFGHGEGDNILVFVPLGCSLQQRYWIYSAFANGHDASVSNYGDWLTTAALTSPTVVMGVPRFYEDVKAQIERSGVRVQDLQERRRAIQQLLGGRIRYLWTGSAPASRAVLDFFNDCGVPLYEGYGLTETCIVAKNCPGSFRVGSVGRVLPDKTVRFDKDGVLIVGGKIPLNSRYTWCNPGDNEKMFLPTAEIRTQDLGHVDEDGFLYIHGRVDDIVVMSSGLNVLVREIEEEIRRHRQVHECVLFGQGKPFLTAIISAAEGGIDGASLAAHIATWNRRCHPEQRVNAAVIVPGSFSIDNGLLTTQHKPVRKKIHARVEQELGAVYSQAQQGTLQPEQVLVLEGAVQ